MFVITDSSLRKSTCFSHRRLFFIQTNSANADKYRILGECLLISSLPGKALRTVVDIARLAEI